jgi:hypothetical protein
MRPECRHGRVRAWCSYAGCRYWPLELAPIETQTEILHAVRRHIQDIGKWRAYQSAKRLRTV